jgi:ABC-type multidrug transport system ATPase subunit
VIALEGVAARHPPMALANLSVAWGAGAHSVVGTRDDGGPLLLALVAGRAAARAGVVRVLDGAPGDAAVRPRVAYVPLEPALPDAMRVNEVLALAAALRGEVSGDPAARLAVLGVASLAPRAVRSLRPEEARAVALAEAITSTRVRVLLVDEPLVGVDPRSVPRMPEALRARAREGCAVLVATASLRDAGDLADDHLLLRRGAAAGQAASLGELADFAPEGVRVRVVSSDPQALLAAVARELAVEAVARRGAAVVARGRDTKALADAVGRAVVASGVDVTEMRVEPPSLEDARVASAGIAAATYDAAYARTRAELAPPPAAGAAGPPGAAGGDPASPPPEAP